MRRVISNILTRAFITRHLYARIFGAIYFWHYHCLMYKRVLHYFTFWSFFIVLKSSLRSKNCNSNCYLTLTLNENIRIQSLLAKNFLNQKRNKFLKIIILHYNWQEHASFLLLTFQIRCTFILQLRKHVFTVCN